MTDDDIRNERAVLERLVTVEERVTALEAALRKALGDRWVDEQKKKGGGDGER
jgi:hypothetical protein